MGQLKGVRVLELASVLAGPSVGQFFAELGADVIKVENLTTGGDVTRTWKLAGEKTDDRSAYFCSVNWGKRSIAVDLSTSEGQSIIHKLALKSDIAIASYKPGDAEKLGVDYQTLSGIQPGLIYGQITGYGSQNSRVGYDAIIQAESGFMSMNGEPGGPALKMPVALMDLLAGHQLKEGVLLALLEKTVTGKGKLVEVSLIQAGISSLANQASNWLVASKLPQKQGSTHPNIAPYGDSFKTRDKKEVILAVGTDRQFQDLGEILGLTTEIVKKFEKNAVRVEKRDELHQILSSVINGVSSQDLYARASKAKIPVGVIQNIEEALNMPEARELLIASDDLRGLRTYVGTSSGQELNPHFLPPPHLGEHSRLILEEFLNFNEETVDKLIKSQIIV